MICFIDLEHESWLVRRQDRLEHYGFIMDTKLKLEELSGQPCIVQRYRDVTLEGLPALGIRALVISGNATGFDKIRRKRVGRAAPDHSRGRVADHRLLRRPSADRRGARRGGRADASSIPR